MSNAICLGSLPLIVLAESSRAPSSEFQAQSYEEAGARVPTTDHRPLTSINHHPPYGHLLPKEGMMRPDH